MLLGWPCCTPCPTKAQIGCLPCTSVLSRLLPGPMSDNVGKCRKCQIRVFGTMPENVGDFGFMYLENVETMSKSKSRYVALFSQRCFLALSLRSTFFVAFLFLENVGSMFWGNVGKCLEIWKMSDNVRTMSERCRNDVGKCRKMSENVEKLSERCRNDVGFVFWKMSENVGRVWKFGKCRIHVFGKC